MSLYQCQVCGCLENTACASQGFTGVFKGYFDWSYAPEREGLKLCSVCGPLEYKDGSPTEYGKWHGRFARHFLPKDEFFTNEQGNLEHIATGSTKVIDFAYNADAIKYSPEYDIFGELVSENKLPDTEFIVIPNELWRLAIPAISVLAFRLEVNRRNYYNASQLKVRNFEGDYQFAFSSPEKEDDFIYSVPLSTELLYTSNVRMIIQYFRRKRG